jgi:outer membrane protein assembly factor BamB
VLVLLSLLCHVTFVAAQIHTTLLPEAEGMVSPSETGAAQLKVMADSRKDPVAVSYVRFNLNTIPKEATFGQCAFRVVTSQQLKAETNVQIFQVQNSWEPNTLKWPPKPEPVKPEPVGAQLAAQVSDQVGEKTAVIYQSPGLCKALNEANKAASAADNKISLQLSTETRNGTVSFYSTPGAQERDYAPLLLLTYTPPDNTFLPPSWTQLHHDPQHTGNSGWRMYNPPDARDYSPTQVTVRSIATASAIYGDPLLYNGNLYNVVHDGGKYFLRAMDGKGQQHWQVDLGALPKTLRAVTASGRLYYVTENAVQTYDLEHKGARGERSIDIDKNKETVISPPTLGPDGRLYLVTNPYVYAYAPYPQHQLLWRHRRGSDKVSAVTLSEDGTTAYVVDGQSGEMVALDSATGALRWALGGLALNIASNEPMPIPVVAEHRIYVTNKFPTGDKLYVIADTGDKATMETIPGTGISSPVIDRDKTAYFVKDGTLWRYRSDETESKQVSKENLGTFSNLVIDGSQNIYGWNKDTHLFSAFTGSGTLLLKQDLRQANLGPNLLLAPEGTLYNVNATQLQAVVPAKFLAKGDTLTLSPELVRLGNNSAFRAGTRIDIPPKLTIETGTNLILISGDTISFGTEFTVKKGARVSAKTGF